MSYSRHAVNRLWIKRAPAILFCDTGTRCGDWSSGREPSAISSFPCPRSSACGPTTWRSGPPRRMSRWSGSPTGSALDRLDRPRPARRDRSSAALLDELRGVRFDRLLVRRQPPGVPRAVASLGLPFTFFPALPPRTPVVHATDFYLDQVGPSSPCPSDGIPRIRLRRPREDFAVIHPFSGSPRKNWPLEKFRALAGDLERTMPVHWCAGPDDPPLAGAVRIRRPLRTGLLAGARPPLHRQRFRHHPPRRGRGDARCSHCSVRPIPPSGRRAVPTSA